MQFQKQEANRYERDLLHSLHVHLSHFNFLSNFYILSFNIINFGHG